MSKHVTQVEIDDPPGYFQMTRTGRVHLVKRVTLVTWRGSQTHVSIEFWCSNLANNRQGELLTVLPPGAMECAGCQRIRYRKTPRVGI